MVKYLSIDFLPSKCHTSNIKEVREKKKENCFLDSFSFSVFFFPRLKLRQRPQFRTSQLGGILRAYGFFKCLVIKTSSTFYRTRKHGIKSKDFFWQCRKPFVSPPDWTWCVIKIRTDVLTKCEIPQTAGPQDDFAYCERYLRYKINLR